MPKKIEMIGKRFGRLVVISEGYIDGTECAWVCKCDCGNVTSPIRGKTLRNGRSKSCGCLSAELVRERFLKHGKSNSGVYKVWRSIIDRCTNEKCGCFRRYGGRGVNVYPGWKNSFEAFFGYVSELPHFGEPGYSLDRIDNNGNYEPGNVRWATAKEQASNRSNTILITFNGESKTISQIATETGLSHSAIYQRYKKGASLYDPKRQGRKDFERDTQRQARRKGDASL